MTQEYSRPRQRARTFGLGVLSGGAASQTGMMSQLQENIQFRLKSAREMLMGQDSSGVSGPLERRQEIRNRRQQLLGGMGGGLGGGGGSDGGSSGSGSGTSTSTPSRGSGSIGTTGTNGRRSSPSTQDDTPSMSEVDSGTRARAMDRGFDGN